MTTIYDIISCISFGCFVMGAAGYDCPNVDFKAQTAFVLISLSVCILCALKSAKKRQ